MLFLKLRQNSETIPTDKRNTDLLYTQQMDMFGSNAFTEPNIAETDIMKSVFDSLDSLNFSPCVNWNTHSEGDAKLFSQHNLIPSEFSQRKPSDSFCRPAGYFKGTTQSCK